jgi:adenine-specific DNA-methyltransferase
LKKIPQAVFTRCEWGRDDYSLNVDSLSPVQVVEEQRVEPEPKTDSNEKTTAQRQRRNKASAMQDLPLFAGFEDGGKPQ